MGRYVKDEINFHGFLNLMRKVHEATLEQVCEGICVPGMMKMIENGQRLPDKLTRDRMMQRMGVAMEGYEDYLPCEEYDKYELRQEILDALEDGKFNEAADMLEKYKMLEERTYTKGLGNVGKQFVLAMEYHIFLLERGNGFPGNKLNKEEKSKVCSLLEEAISLTVKSNSHGNEGHRACLQGQEANDVEVIVGNQRISFVFHHLLAEQEINLLIEYLWYQEPEASLAGYDKLLSYIQSSKLDYIGKVKTYPKAVYYRICKAWQKGMEDEDIPANFNLCETAIDTIIGSGRSYYFTEILEEYERIYRQADSRGLISKKRRIELQGILQERMKWKEMLCDLYVRYGHNPNMENFCYVYREVRSYCIGDVIRLRRKMFGMTKEQLCEGICSIKTLTRIEGKKAKTQMPIVRELLERLNLYPEYIRTRVFTNDYRIHRASDRLVNCLNTKQMEEAEELLTFLLENLNLDIVQNYQFLRKIEAELRLNKKEITKEEFLAIMEEILERTIEKKKLFSSEKLFLSWEEEGIVYQLLMKRKGQESPYLQVMEKILRDYGEKKSIRSLAFYEFLLTGYCSFIGSSEEYEKSTRLSDNLIKICLKYKRIEMLANNLYNMIWNYIKENPAQDKEKFKLDLQYCIYLSRIKNNTDYENFFMREKAINCSGN